MTKLQSRTFALLGIFLLILAFGAAPASADPATTETAAPQAQQPADPKPVPDLLPGFLWAVHAESFYDPSHSPNCTWICYSGATGSSTASSESNCAARCRAACGTACVY
jgi:hypothetical protein